MTGLFGDTIAMTLVAIGSVLLALLIWLLMRKYNREHPRNVEPSRIATPGTRTPETTATILGPCNKRNEYLSISGVGVTKQASEELDKKSKETPAVSLREKSASTEKPTDNPTGKTTDKKQDKQADKPEERTVAEKEGAEAEAQGHGSKNREGSPGSPESLEQNKGKQPKGEPLKKKSKKSDQLPPPIPDSGSSKHKSKQPKRSKPGGAQPDTAIATRGPGAVAPTAPPEGVTQELTSDTTSPASPQKPSQAEASAPQASQLGAKSHTVAIVDRDPTSDTHDLDDSTLQKLRKEVLMRRASHASMHSTRLRPVVESPKVSDGTIT